MRRQYGRQQHLCQFVWLVSTTVLLGRNGDNVHVQQNRTLTTANEGVSITTKCGQKEGIYTPLNA